MKALALALAGCATAVQTTDTATRGSVWSDGHSDSPGVPAPVVCTDVVSHPCPWLLYTHELLVDGNTVTWTDAGGGADANGIAASVRSDVVETATVNDDGSLMLPTRGDDGGLRHALTLSPTPGGGWEADVTWTLFTVAGHTTFKLTVTP